MNKPFKIHTHAAHGIKPGHVITMSNSPNQYEVIDVEYGPRDGIVLTVRLFRNTRFNRMVRWISSLWTAVLAWLDRWEDLLQMEDLLRSAKRQLKKTQKP